MMTFTSIEFWALFAASFLLLEAAHFWLQSKAFRATRKWTFLAFSLTFYGLASGKLLGVMLLSIVVNHMLIRWLALRSSKAVVFLGVAFNVCLLGVFKYAYFIAGLFPEMMPQDGFQWGGFRLEQWMLPLGISFYTFQSISCLIDVHRKRLAETPSLLSFATYITFFPQLVAGPIIRAADFLPQLDETRASSMANRKRHLMMILQGFFKKLVFGDLIGVLLVDPVFDAPLEQSAWLIMLGLYGYSMQVYADFSGYTDMAQGMAGLLGMTLPKNFNFPYKASSPADFWRRWHMSLSHWWKDYVYIPLGGNRSLSWVSMASLLGALLAWGFAWNQGGGWLIVAGTGLLVAAGALMFPSFQTKLAVSTNVMLVMLMGGLWHGSHENFILWGGINGLAIVAWIWAGPSQSKWARAAGWLFTFHVVVLSRIWFRAGSITSWEEYATGPHPNDAWATALALWDQLNHLEAWKFNPTDLTFTIGAGASLLILSYVIHWLPSAWQERAQTKTATAPLWVMWLFWMLLIALNESQLAYQGKPFIYWQF